LEAGKELRADFFLQRREMGIINIGGDGTVTADGKEYQVKTHDCIYIGMGVKELKFSSADRNNAAKFYFNSTPAHKSYPIEISAIDKAVATKLGSKNECNERTIYKFIHPDGIKSCQLVMGMTMLESGSVWNTMPCHTHDRRMEVYLYFNLGNDGLVFHMMGEPEETRHIVVRNEEAVISPSWSIHSGVGTKNYTFIWGMAGENQAFSDMDAVDIGRLK
jgi:4-deoxy-L-threo-5-hexosulose-uronate ketol-isomerase